MGPKSAILSRLSSLHLTCLALKTLPSPSFTLTEMASSQNQGATTTTETKTVKFDEGYDPVVIADNNRIAFNNRIYVSILLGIGAGVLGLENFWGALFYIIGSAFGLLMFFFFSIGLGQHKTFYYKWSDIITSSLSTNLFTFVMVWTLFYDIVHVYV